MALSVQKVFNHFWLGKNITTIRIDYKLCVLHIFNVNFMIDMLIKIFTLCSWHLESIHIFIKILPEEDLQLKSLFPKPDKSTFGTSEKNRFL